MTYAAQNIAERRQALRNIGKARPTTYKKRPIVAYCSAPLYRKKQANPMPHLRSGDLRGRDLLPQERLQLHRAAGEVDAEAGRI